MEPTAQGQQQVGQCRGDVSGDYKFTVNLGDGTTLVPTDTFCNSKADGTKVPFDSTPQAYVDYATFKLRDTFGFPFSFQYRGWRLTVDFSKLSRQR